MLTGEVGEGWERNQSSSYGGEKAWSSLAYPLLSDSDYTVRYTVLDFPTLVLNVRQLFFPKKSIIYLFILFSSEQRLFLKVGFTRIHSFMRF